MRVVHAKPILVGISLMLITVMFTGQSSAKIDPETIVGLWLFDQNSGQTVTDSSGNANHGKFVKNPKWVKGKFGNALEFDAGPYVEVPLSKTNDFTGWEAISVCAWYKTDVLSDEKWMIRDGQVMIGQTAAPNEWSIAIRINGAWINTEGLKSNFPVEKGVWTHVAGVYNGSTSKLFVNGKFDREKPAKGGLEKNTNPIMIGSRGGGQLYDGLIDEVAIFSVPLSTDDIKHIMDQGFEKIQAVSPGGKLSTVWGDIKKQ